MFKFIKFLILFFPLFIMATPLEDALKIKVNNAVLAKVNDNTISVIDVKKNMDLVFHRIYPEMRDSPQARYQFYAAHWKRTLQDMINGEMILADAKAKDLKISDGEIREELENRFGPNVIATLENLGMSYNEAWNLTKKEMTVMRMNWFFVNSKALQNITPKMIKEAYARYIKAHPPEEIWTYQTILVKPCDNAKIVADTIIKTLKDKDPVAFPALLSDMESVYKCSIELSNEKKLSSKEASIKNREIYSALKRGSFSNPLLLTSAILPSFRIVYLKDSEKKFPPAFEELYNDLKDELLQKEFISLSRQYIERLKKTYGYDDKMLKEMLPDSSFEPFTIEQ